MNFSKDSSTWRDRAFFHSLAYISGESDRLLTKILSHTYRWTKNAPLNFRSSPDPDWQTYVIYDWSCFVNVVVDVVECSVFNEVIAHVMFFSLCHSVMYCLQKTVLSTCFS